MTYKKIPTYLTDEQRQVMMEIPPDLADRDLARYYTLTSEELALVHRRRRPANRFGFGEGALAGQAPEAPLDQQQAHLPPQKRHIPLAAHAPIMTLGADVLAARTSGPIRETDESDFHLALRGKYLLKNLKVRQSQRHQNTLLGRLARLGAPILC